MRGLDLISNPKSLPLQILIRKHETTLKSMANPIGSVKVMPQERFMSWRKNFLEFEHFFATSNFKISFSQISLYIMIKLKQALRRWICLTRMRLMIPKTMMYSEENNLDFTKTEKFTKNNDSCYIWYIHTRSLPLQILTKKHEHT